MNALLRLHFSGSLEFVILRFCLYSHTQCTCSIYYTPPGRSICNTGIYFTHAPRLLLNEKTIIILVCANTLPSRGKYAFATSIVTSYQREPRDKLKILSISRLASQKGAFIGQQDISHCELAENSRGHHPPPHARLHKSTQGISCHILQRKIPIVVVKVKGILY